MTISIMLEKRPYISPADLTNNKITLLNEIFKHFGGHFEPRRIEIWKDASDTALNGVQLNDIKLDTPLEVVNALDAIYRQHKSDPDLLTRMIAIIRGVWFKEEAKSPGYIAMNNEQDWRDQYGDIEANIYQTDDYSDIVEILWAKKLVEPYVSGFIGNFHDYEAETFDMLSMVYGLGVPTIIPVHQWRASYYKRPDFFLVKVLSNVESGDKNLRSYIRLASRNALMNDLYGIGYFREYLKKIAKNRDVEIDFKGSLSLVGENPDSFSKLYEDLAVSLKDIIQSSLKRDDEINQKMSEKSARLAGYDSVIKNP